MSMTEATHSPMLWQGEKELDGLANAECLIESYLQNPERRERAMQYHHVIHSFLIS
jgi:hypothetical protein